MKKVDTTWLCIAIAFLFIGLISSKTYLIIGFSFLVMALSSKNEE